MVRTEFFMIWLTKLLENKTYCEQNWCVELWEFDVEKNSYCRISTVELESRFAIIMQMLMSKWDFIVIYKRKN